MHCAKHLDALLYALCLPTSAAGWPNSYTCAYSYSNNTTDSDSYAYSEGDTNAASDSDGNSHANGNGRAIPYFYSNSYSAYSHQLRWPNVPGQRRSTMVCRHVFCGRFDFFDYS